MGNSNTVATAKRELVVEAGGTAAGAFQQSALDTPVAQAAYIDIIATNDFSVAILGVNNLVPMSLNGRIWGYRAKADGPTYAALVQSEQLSA